MNIVILRGRLSTEPRCTELPSGDIRWSLELSTTDPDGRRISVPIACAGPSALATAASSLGAGDELVVAGSVQRRFFRAGGVTQSRTEVVASELVPAKSAKRVARLLERQAGALGGPAA